ncbi:MAG TPA: LUD domain-containing protein [Spirochaetia bacterium]|nr:LUD domain-containing protein [Spirochaetia bacterium]
MPKTGFGPKMAAALADTESKRGRNKALSLICPNIQAARERHPVLAGRLRKIKEESLARLDDLLAQAVARLRANGCQVFMAADAAAARDYIAGLAGKGLLVKSKSNVGKEIGVVAHLAARGVTVVETDLGDRLNQLAGSQASHPLAPAIHLPLARVRELLARESGRELPEDVNELVRAARETLRPYLARAGVGLSGANAIAADTGAVVLMENEGNIRAVTSLPAVHVVVAGITKIVPTLEDAVTVVEAASVFGAGQDLGTYMSVINGPGQPGINPDGSVSGQLGPREVHVVLLDNGRSRALAGGWGEAFYCINCGGCLNFCPVYRVLGGGFGHRYIGGIGVVQTALTGNLAAAGEAGLWACLSCGNCMAACPAQIDTPDLISRLRGEIGGKRPVRRLVTYLLRDQVRLRRVLILVRRLTGPLWEEVPARRALRLRLGPARSRLVPAPRIVLTAGTGQPIALPAGNRPRAVLYSGCLINTCYPEIATSAVRVLSRHGVAVEPPGREPCCGLPLWNAGDREGARELARRNIAGLETVDGAVLTLCATCGNTLRNFYPRWLAGDSHYAGRARLLAGRVRDVTVFLADDLGLAASQPGREDLPTVTYHDPCHLRLGLGVTRQPRQLLRSSTRFVEMAGADRCCGFGGLVSLKHYLLSTAITDEKLNFANLGAGTLATACPGCMAALTDGLNRLGLPVTVRHVVELVDEAGL